MAINLVAIAVVLGIYSVLNGKFEIILASVLIMIYAKIDAYIHDSTEELSEIKKLVGVISGTTKAEEDSKVSPGCASGHRLDAFDRGFADSVDRAFS